jgi:enoyl-CoA hydratase
MTTMSSSDERVLVSSAHGIRTVTLNVPDKLNAVDAAMLTSFAEAVEGAAADGERVVVLRGAGRGFCSGADLTGRSAESDSHARRDTGGGSGEVDISTLTEGNRVVRAITTTPVVVVSVVQGPCAGIGVPIALAADLVIASTEAFFQLAFTRIGLMPDGGATALVAASIGRARALRMALLAERVPAVDALALGLLTEVVGAEELDGRVTEVVGALVQGPAVAYARTKEAVNLATLGELEGAFTREEQGQTGLITAPDFAEGVAAFTGKRAPAFTDRP